MKFHVVTGPACMLLLGACVTYPTQTASNVEVEGAVLDEEAPANKTVAAREQIEYVDDDRIICKRTIITGSRFKNKVCMSWFEWKETRLRSKEYIDGIQSVSTRSHGVSSGPSMPVGRDVSPGD